MTTPEEDLEYLWKRRDLVLQRVELSVLYHQKRERFLSLVDRATKLIAIAGGSAAVARVGGENAVVWIGAIIAGTSALALVAALSDRARLHAELAGAFKRLDADMAAHGPRDFTEPDLNRWEGRSREIEVGEPPALAALVRLCQNEQAWAAGRPDSMVKLRWHERAFAQYLDFPAHRSKPLTAPSK